MALSDTVIKMYIDSSATSVFVQFLPILIEHVDGEKAVLMYEEEP